ncbi:MAG: nucleoside deaminase, partial [Deltaproteobacteria bacterium]|nr:nucleoside deaminase [Deltaproteobacteria bacterium]
MKLPEIHIRLPQWIETFLQEAPRQHKNRDERMRFVIELSRRNTTFKTGGPFGAAVFDADGHLIAPGVNLVTSANCSLLHAETLALMLAQQALGSYDLSSGGLKEFELVASTAPCAMCFGALIWSGVRRLTCGARSEDARAIGFDEGPKPADWETALTTRGITVTNDVLRDEAAAVLRE